MRVFLLFWAVLMNAIDGLTTLAAMGTEGFVELNPFVAFLLTHGNYYFIILKAIVVPLALWALACLYHYRSARIGMWTASLVYTAVAFHNMLLLGVI